MEKDLQIKSTLFAAPATETIALAKSQIGFMNMFARPLFENVTDIMPPMQYCVDELLGNIRAWEGRIAEERLRQQHELDDPMRDGMLSPRSMSMAVGAPDASQGQNDLRVAAMMNIVLNKNPFKKDFLDEGAPLGHYNSLPDIQTTKFCPEEDQDPTQDTTIPYFSMYSHPTLTPGNLHIYRRCWPTISKTFQP